MKPEFRSVFNRVRALIIEELQVDLDKVTMNAALRGHNLKADSLDLVNLVMALAQEFDVEMRDEEIRKVDTVGDIVNYLEKYLNFS